MAYLKEKTEQLESALERWKESLEAEFSTLNRDAAIQRFEFSVELLWKTLKIYLEDKEKITCHSPRSCFREAKNIFDLSDSEVEKCLAMVEDRNLASHLYSEKMADDLYKKLDGYYELAARLFGLVKDEEQ